MNLPNLIERLLWVKYKWYVVQQIIENTHYDKHSFTSFINSQPIVEILLC